MLALLHDKYEIIEIIKTGGMARVYKAIHLNIPGIYLAIKELTNTFFTQEQKNYSIDRFQKEAMLLARLRHPSLPVVHDYFVENNNYYIVMDFIEGSNLQEILKNRDEDGLSWEEVIEWGIQMCDTLDYLHRQTPPVIHRDIKPSNFIRTRISGKIMLIDFGIARFYDVRETGTLVGTMGYASPEPF
ncbi:MAG TPA: serine/threonine-protein kinase, partial [Candidatus Eremiobacteraeota bacterium]|nr:serine/threonine-protein kinase [Candidatus Eremiobacteraeota bacterium]